MPVAFPICALIPRTTERMSKLTVFTARLCCSGLGDCGHCCFIFSQPALEDQIHLVITGVSALISTQPQDSASATPVSTGRLVNCAGQGDLGLTVSVCSHLPVLAYL